MYHGNQHNIIESDDITDIKHVHIVKEGKQIIAHIKAVLDPHKDYQASKEVHVHLTNGVNHRTLGPFKHAFEEEGKTEDAPLDAQQEGQQP